MVLSLLRCGKVTSPLSPSFPVCRVSLPPLTAQAGHGGGRGDRGEAPPVMPGTQWACMQETVAAAVINVTVVVIK